MYEELNMKRWFTYCAYGHNSKKFTNGNFCQFCEGNHDFKEYMNNENPKCINCSNHNGESSMKRNVKHSATDYKKCETFKARKTVKS